MPKKTKFDKLPKEILDLVASLRGKGRTLDEIQAKLRELQVDVARSTTARHLAKIDAIGERIRENRVIAEALVSQFGDEPDDKTLRLIMEMLKGTMMQLQTAAATGEGAQLDAQDVYFLTTSLDRLAKARATDAQRQIKEREKITKEAAQRAEEAVKTKGLSRDTVNLIKAAILGVDAPPAPAAK